MTESSTGYNGWNSSQCRGTEYCQARCPRFVDKEGASWRLRSAREADADRLADMYADISTADRAQGLPPVDAHRRQEWVETLLEEGHNIVAEGPDQLVGHVAYTPVEADQPEVAVFVHPEFHNRGIGTELCNRIVAAAADAGREALELYVERRNRAAIAVYRRLGFEVVDGGHDMRMVRRLDDSVATSVRAPPAEQSPRAEPVGVDSSSQPAQRSVHSSDRSL
ncbi:GNAT family N-acetyltransferase [Halohasta salina]|uniref:GNAT family N-acetyltransferase n=1 Tax=Halohasta salina TaxID=2961621 RepID=UPI0020A4047A|nr:GNAT family N-acetyltransferase [Halohasta salina]